MDRLTGSAKVMKTTSIDADASLTVTLSVPVNFVVPNKSPQPVINFGLRNSHRASKSENMTMMVHSEAFV